MFLSEHIVNKLIYKMLKVYLTHNNPTHCQCCPGAPQEWHCSNNQIKTAFFIHVHVTFIRTKDVQTLKFSFFNTNIREQS